MNSLPVGTGFREATPCPEMLSVFSEPAIEIVRVTTNPDHDAHCRHMQVAHDLFTADSRRIVIERQNGRGCGRGERVEYLLCDIEGWHPLMGPSAHLWIGTVVENAGEDPYVVPKFLLNPRSTWTGNYWTQSQPVMSPDCKTIFFNSDWLNKTGHPQVFAVRGFEFPEATG